MAVAVAVSGSSWAATMVALSNANAIDCSSVCMPRRARCRGGGVALALVGPLCVRADRAMSWLRAARAGRIPLLQAVGRLVSPRLASRRSFGRLSPSRRVQS